ncbi:MAG: hypothetical protein GX577_06555 [Leptolinea sp.]|nr:hypothetical protein [Leptolinea sp.]
MTQFVALVEGVEVNGETVLSIVDGMGILKDKALKILSDYGIDNPQPGLWYSQQAWLDSFKQIAAKFRPLTLTSIGRKIPENAVFPPDIDEIGKALAAIDVAYHINHRIDSVPLFDPSTGVMSEGIGHYFVKSTGPNSAIFICNNPYPCDFDRGIIDAMAFRYRPAGSNNVTITHDDESHCRKNGGQECRYIVRW